jgi:Domain of unknown function (DUF4145)
MQSYTPPSHGNKAFHCPKSGVYANQIWGGACITRFGHHTQLGEVEFCLCVHCQNESIWLSGQMIHPDGGNAPLPNPDLPEEIARDFEEARGIVGKSPRGAAAILRLAIQKLCQHLGEAGKDLNTDIGSLVKKGLPERVRQALDAVRVIGNNAVHPGQINLTDDSETATALFGLVNFIAEKMISEPREIERLHALIPATAIEAINKRDGRPLAAPIPGV